MYNLYQKDSNGLYILRHKVYLAGYLNGIIPNVLIRKYANSLPKADPTEKEPWQWYLKFPEDLKFLPKQLDYLAKVENPAVVIDIKPGQGELWLSELMNVWGWTDDAWTPIMYHLRPLVLGDKPRQVDKNVPVPQFQGENREGDIFYFSYLRGTIKNGALINPDNPRAAWGWPGKSSTNSVSLLPDVLDFFYEQAKRVQAEKENYVFRP